MVVVYVIVDVHVLVVVVVNVVVLFVLFVLLSLYFLTFLLVFGRDCPFCLSTIFVDFHFFSPSNICIYPYLTTTESTLLPNIK